MDQNMPQISSLTDQDRLEDLLNQEKYMISSYSSFVPEASDTQLRQVLTDNLNQTFQTQFSIFEQMNQHGWYPQKNAMPADVTTAQQKFAQMKTQMGN